MEKQTLANKLGEKKEKVKKKGIVNKKIKNLNSSQFVSLFWDFFAMDVEHLTPPVHELDHGDLIEVLTHLHYQIYACQEKRKDKLNTSIWHRSSFFVL